VNDVTSGCLPNFRAAKSMDAKCQLVRQKLFWVAFGYFAATIAYGIVIGVIPNTNLNMRLPVYLTNWIKTGTTFHEVFHVTTVQVSDIPITVFTPLIMGVNFLFLLYTTYWNPSYCASSCSKKECHLKWITTAVTESLWITLMLSLTGARTVDGYLYAAGFVTTLCALFYAFEKMVVKVACTHTQTKGSSTAYVGNYVSIRHIGFAIMLASTVLLVAFVLPPFWNQFHTQRWVFLLAIIVGFWRWASIQYYLKRTWDLKVDNIAYENTWPEYYLCFWYHQFLIHALTMSLVLGYVATYKAT
jgi:hypothetical protein